jgi:hypothetical protein
MAGLPVFSNDNIRFYWSLGDIGVSFDGMKNEIEPVPFINVGNINWIMKNGLGFGFHVFDVENWRQALVLPVEINYSPFGDNDKHLFLSLYGRGGWLIQFDSENNLPFSQRNGFFGAAGLRAAWIPPAFNGYWSVFTGAFIEYTSKNELRMGVSLDTSVVAVLAAVLFNIIIDDEDEDE